MSLTSGKVLGISITQDSRKNILEEIQKYLIRNKRGTRSSFVIVTPNPEQIVAAQRDKHFAKILNGADVAIPDGIGVVWAAKTLGVDANLQRIPGIELFEQIVALASKRAVRIGLIGGKGDLAVQALECLKKQLPSLEGEAKSAPELKIINDRLTAQNFDGFLEEITQWITEKKIQILFVGLGAPKQEYLIEKLSGQRHPNPLVLMAVGGSFDILAGRVRRAPLFIRMMGFEWLWRLMREPWRFRRQLALIEFVIRVFQTKFRPTTK